MDRPNRMELQSADGAQLNLDALYQIAPSCFTEVADPDTGGVKRVINFDVLRQLLGDNAVEDAPEAYEFNWVGKQAARAEVLEPIKKTLRPVKEDSVDWDNTQNLYIEGDNLKVLKLLQKSYLGKVKMIYIDPPYNTGNDFVYHDDFAMSADEYAEASGAVDELGNKYIKNMDSNGRFHSDWCSMMYSRLMVARTLLTEDGVIFISIDDNEVENLRKICDEVLGESNFIAPFIWSLPRGINAGLIARSHEYILCYTKNYNVKKYFNRLTEDVEYSIERCNKKIDSRHPESVIEFPAGIRYEGKDQILEGEIPGAEKITILGKLCFKDGKLASPVKLSAGWTMKNMFLSWLKGEKVTDLKGQTIKEFFFKENGRLYSKKEMSTLSIKSVLKDIPDTQIARKEMESLFGSQDIFSYPKPVELSKLLSKLASDKDSIILDFFSGSATTAHAVMQLNAEDGGNRKFIMVQISEETPEDSEARKAGYNTIPEIAKERIRRAGKKIKEESPLTTADLDTGFRVFRLDEGNYEDVKRSPKEFKQDQLDLFLNNIKTDRNDLDLLFGCMLDWGVQLSLPMTQEVVDGKTIYTVNDGDLVACFAENVSEDVVKAMAEKMPLRVIFRDSCFAQDADKINIYETFKQKLDWSDQEVVKNIRVI